MKTGTNAVLGRWNSMREVIFAKRKLAHQRN